MKAIKVSATVIAMTAVLLTSSGFTTASPVPDTKSDEATISLQVSGGRLG